MNNHPDRDWLDSALLKEEPGLEGNVFVKGVLRTLPAKTERTRTVILAISFVMGSLLALFVFDTELFVQEAIENVFSHSSIFDLSSSFVSLGVIFLIGWGACSLASQEL